ncbi:MAG: TatD family hydrolase [Clostridia bacterium]|nr:TatD family hydrolase [Clostridia bacterium]
MEFFDSHSHYNDEKFDEDREKIIEETYNSGVTKLICAGYDIESSKLSLKIADEYNFIYSIVGISPNDVPETLSEVDLMIEEIESIIKQDKNNKIVAIGEIGLDYYWNKENKAIQKEVFIKQVKLANKYNMPIVIHTREAVDDTLKILRENSANNEGIFHCCPLNRELVKQGLDLGFYISFAGPVTFRNSKNAKEIVNMVPLDKILIETDSPYLAPEPKRGTRNDSRNVKHIAEKIAEFKGITLQEIAKHTYENTIKIFKIKDM